ncbi:heat-shock protein, partial [Mesorhizobium sp. M8A.F.Ca.ET.173.01.1.1]
MMQNTQNLSTDILENLLTEHHDFNVD